MLKGIVKLNIKYLKNGTVSVFNSIDDVCINHCVCDKVIFRHTDYLAMDNDGNIKGWYSCKDIEVNAFKEE